MQQIIVVFSENSVDTEPMMHEVLHAFFNGTTRAGERSLNMVLDTEP